MASPGAAATEKSAGLYRIAIVLSLLLAFGLMLAAASGDLWLDEIWSVRMASRLHSVADAFTLRYDNNHPLNTLYLYLLGQPRLLLEYRLASVLGGIGCIGLVGYAAWRKWGARESLLAIILCATSFPILLYSSEARGYGLLMLLALVAYVAWSRAMQRAGWVEVIAFWLACALGLLAQVTFVIALVAFALGQLVADQESRSARQRLSKLARMHAVPALFAAWWYWFFISRLVLGGSGATGTWAVVGEASSLLLGLQDSPLLKLIAFLSVLSIAAVGARQLRKSGDSHWLFFACILIVAPALLLLASRGRIVHARYFLACFPFFLLLASRLLCLGWNRQGQVGRALLLLVLAIYLAGNLQRDAFLLRDGRGGYSKAIAYMLQETPRGPVLVASDYDFRNVLVLDFHAARLPGGGRVHYVVQSKVRQLQPEWFLLHSQEIAHVSPGQITVPGVGAYQLVRSYGYAGVSGWNWYLYRRAR